MKNKKILNLLEALNELGIVYIVKHTRDRQWGYADRHYEGSFTPSISEILRDIKIPSDVKVITANDNYYYLVNDIIEVVR